jgi:hypothetical protein
MKITWNDLMVPFDEDASAELLETWTWLTGNDKTPVIITSIGDMFLVDGENKIYWLNAGEGILELVAETDSEFQAKLNDIEQAREWFMTGLVAEIKQSGKELAAGKLYSYVKLPVLGGSYTADNFILTDISVHFVLAGQVHEQIRDLPDGTVINSVKIVDE